MSRCNPIIAVGLAAAALAAPASAQSTDAPTWVPHPRLDVPAHVPAQDLRSPDTRDAATERPAPASAAPKSMASLTEAEILASRGKSAPRPVHLAGESPADAGGDGDAVRAAGAATTIALVALAGWVLTTRRRGRAAA